MAYVFTGQPAKDQKEFFEETKSIYFADELNKLVNEKDIFKDKPFYVIEGDYELTERYSWTIQYTGLENNFYR
jgi:hypothetical protein